jgi:hypothetical protein
MQKVEFKAITKNIDMNDEVEPLVRSSKPKIENDGTATAHCPSGSASMSFKSWRDPLGEDQPSTDEVPARHGGHGRSSATELAYAAQERWLVKRSLFDKFEVDASTSR